MTASKIQIKINLRIVQRSFTCETTRENGKFIAFHRMNWKFGRIERDRAVPHIPFTVWWRFRSECLLLIFAYVLWAFSVIEIAFRMIPVSGYVFWVLEDAIKAGFGRKLKRNRQYSLTSIKMNNNNRNQAERSFLAF